MVTQTIRRPGQYSSPTAAVEDIARASLDTDDAAATSETAPAAEESALKKSPIERWRESIEAAGLSEEDADKILDAVLASGYYEKTYKLFQGKMTVALRSRDSASLQRVSDALDAIRTNDVRVHTQMMNRYNLAASLVRYQDKHFKHPGANATANDRDKAFVERLTFVDTIPAPVLVQLYTLLSKFDNAVFAAMSEGAELGF